MIRTDLSNEAYHKLSDLSKSQLDDLDRSPYIFWARHLARDRPERPEPNAAMAMGTLVHTLVLEPAEQDKRYAIGPSVKTKAAKEWKDFVAGLKAGVEPITLAEMEQGMAMAESVRRLPEIAELLSVGRAEVSGFWRDPDTGVACRCRLDWEHPAGDGVVIMDLKTCLDASPEGFAKSVWNWKYHKQAAYYSDGYAMAAGVPVHGFVFAAVEKDYPYAAAAYMLSDEDLEQGRRAYRRNLRKYVECTVSGTWPGYANQIQILQLPAWAKKEIE